VLALLSLICGITFAIFLGFKLYSEPIVESIHLVWSGLLLVVLFIGFGVKLMQVLWSRHHEKTF
jgi:hypothetical protein